MEGAPLVLEISSDEEQCLDEREGQRNSDYDWVKEFLVSDGEQDEVVVLSVVEKPERKSKSSVKDMDDEDDDDCLVLDGDPENIVTTVKKAPAGSDELVVVGEKGQVACRDYPHPRHLCANFPFSSNPHEKHCEQCHCYVCDSLAPCHKWGTGLSSTDHCHATDKSEMWKTLRANFKLGKTAPIPVSTNFGTSCNVGSPLHNHNLPVDTQQFSPNSILLSPFSSAAVHTHSSERTHSSTNRPQNPASLILKPQNQASQPIMMPASAPLNSSLQNQVSMPVTIPVRLTTNLTTPHTANRGRCNESTSSLPRNKYQSSSVPRQLLGVRNHAIQRGRGHGAVSLEPQFLQSYMMMPKLVGSAGSTLPMNYPSHNSSGLNNHVISAQQYNTYHPTTGFLGNGTIYQQSEARAPSFVLYPQPSSGQAILNCVNKNIPAYDSKAYYQSNDSQNLYGSCIQDSPAASSNVTHLNRLNEHQIGTQHENAQGIMRQDACQQRLHNESQIESVLKEDSSAFDSSSINQPPNIKESGTEFTSSTNLSLLEDIKKFLFDEVGSVPMEENSAWASELNIASSYLSPIDSDMFFI